MQIFVLFDRMTSAEIEARIRRRLDNARVHFVVSEEFVNAETTWFFVVEDAVELPSSDNVHLNFLD